LRGYTVTGWLPRVSPDYSRYPRTARRAEPSAGWPPRRSDGSRVLAPSLAVAPGCPRPPGRSLLRQRRDGRRRGARRRGYPLTVLPVHADEPLHTYDHTDGDDHAHADSLPGDRGVRDRRSECRDREQRHVVGRQLVQGEWPVRWRGARPVQG